MANKFKVFTSNQIGKDNTLVGDYTVGSGVTAIVIGLSIANIIDSSVTVDVQLDSGASTTYLIKGAPLLSGSSLVPVGGDQKLVLTEGYKINVKSSVDKSIDVVLSVLEQ